MPLVECVPNVSEGRRTDAIAALAHAISAPGVQLLDQSSDPSHNRTVYTFVGQPQPMQEAVLRLFASAIAHIDLRAHTGVHPRVGAVDVVPFVPLADATMADCVELARSTAELVTERYELPTYLYEEAAANDRRRNLADIRRGGFEGLSARMREPEWHPDFGEPRPHPTAGVSAIGARPILIAYNVNLASDRLSVARRIASVIRASSGGFSHVKAMGVTLEHRGIVQVSMNLTDYQRTSMLTVFDAVTREALEDGVEVLESEIVGLVPEDALPPDPMARLKLSAGDADRTLERRMSSLGTKD
jgi:glutamate formiminotransferase / 5-formyltetrahydrofolate cyclo-ligase